MRDVAHKAFSCYRESMKTVYMQNFIDRLFACGVCEDDATILINDFVRDRDFEGLADYCAELERIHVAALQS